MPISTSLVGTTVGPNVTKVDARWAMAYAAGLGDMLECYIDTRREGGIIAHPLFPVCVEWQIAGTLRAKHRVTLSQVEAVARSACDAAHDFPSADSSADETEYDARQSRGSSGGAPDRTKSSNMPPPMSMARRYVPPMRAVSIAKSR